MIGPGMRKFRRHLTPIVPDHLLDPEVPALIRFPRKFMDGWRMPPSDLTWHATPGVEMVPCCEPSSAWWTSGTSTPTVCTLSPSSSGYRQGCRTRNAWWKSSDREWAEWAEPLLWNGWLSHHQPHPEVVHNRPFVGIFAAVDGILPGQNTYRVLRSLHPDALVPSPVNSEDAPSSGENDSHGRPLPRPLARRRRTRRRGTCSTSSNPSSSPSCHADDPGTEDREETDVTNLMMSPNHGGGLLSVVQSIDLRLSQVAVDSRVRRALTLLHRLRRYYTCDGSRAGFPSALEGAEAILAAHAVADGGDDTVTENSNQDVAFVEQWWAVLRPLLPAPQAVTLSGVIALVDSVEEEKAQQHGPDNATGEKGTIHHPAPPPRHGMKRKSSRPTKQMKPGCWSTGTTWTGKKRRHNAGRVKHGPGMTGPSTTACTRLRRGLREEEWW